MTDLHIDIGSENVRVTHYFNNHQQTQSIEAHCGRCEKMTMRRVTINEKLQSSWHEENHSCNGFTIRKV